MNLKLHRILFLVAAILLSVACEGRDRNAEGDALARSVRERFDDTPDLRGATSRVHVRSGGGGTIVLSGTTDTEADRALAETFARGIQGVQVVENQITVTGAAGAAPAASQAPAPLNVEAVRREAMESGERIGDSDEDARIYHEIRRRIVEDRTTPKRAIFVDVVKGDVTLRGMVSSVQAREEAVAATKGLEGVNTVRNLLQINSPAP